MKCFRNQTRTESIEEKLGIPEINLFTKISVEDVSLSELKITRVFLDSCTISHQFSTNSVDCEGSGDDEQNQKKCWRWNPRCRGEFIGTVIGAFVVLFTVILHEVVWHFVKKTPDEEARFDATSSSSYVLWTIQILLERAAEKC